MPRSPGLGVRALSRSTAAYDRGEKLANYQLIPSLREVMLVAHDDRRVDLWRRTQSGWTQVTLRAEDCVELESLPGVRMTIDEIYFDPLAG